MIVVDISSGQRGREREREGKEREGGRGTGVDPCRVNVRRRGTEGRWVASKGGLGKYILLVVLCDV